MKSESVLTCRRARVLLEAWIDADLSAARAAQVTAHVDGCAGCRREAMRARRVRAGLRELPAWTCPPSVAAEVLQATAAAHRETPAPTRIAGAWRRLVRGVAARVGDLLVPSERGRVLRPAWALAGVVIAVGLGVVLVSQVTGPREPVPGTYAAADVERAQRQVLWALAYVGHVTGEAGNSALQGVAAEVSAAIGQEVVGSITGAMVAPLEKERTP